MKKLFGLILVASLTAGVQMSCKKHTDTPNTPGTNGPTLADTLRATCISPFEGHGDSSHIYLPTAFTPNGDGLNDYYSLTGRGLTAGYFSSLNIKIFDTTGTIVYQSAGTTLPEWDGVDQNTHAQTSKYKFYVKVKYTTSGNITDSGSTYLYHLSGNACVNAVWADTSRYRFPSQFDPSTGYNPAWSPNETYCH